MFYSNKQFFISSSFVFSVYEKLKKVFVKAKNGPLIDNILR